MSSSKRVDKKLQARRDRRKALAFEQNVFDKLQQLERERVAYRELAARIVGSVLERHPLPPDGPIVEIGAGAGHLRELLPESVRSRIVHTEPTERGLRELSQRFPDARVARASVQELPFKDGEVAGVLGLCVLDLLPDLASAADELVRVLQPGGRFIHFLDQSPYLQSIFERMAPLGLVIFPNVLADPSASHWPEDLFVAEGAQLRAIAGILARARHPAAQPLAQYISVFAAQPFVSERALTEFDQVSQDPKLREMLKAAFQQAYKLASPPERAALGTFKGFMVSSSKELAARFERELAGDGLELVHNEFVVAADVRPRQGADAYRSVSVGQHRSLPAPPAELLGRVSPKLEPEQMLVEQAMLVLVANKR